MSEKEKRISTAGEIFRGFLYIASAFALLFGAYSYIDLRIDSKINNPEFIRKIASSVRPSVIFNSQGSIEIDMGAMQFIEDIKIITSDDLPKFPKTVILSPKEYLAHAPLLSSLDAVEYVITVERGKKLDWVYSLVLSMHDTDIQNSRFRLEIVR